MAARFDASTDAVTSTASVPSGSTASYTVTVFAKLVSDRNDFQRLFALSNTTVDSTYHRISTGSDGTTLSAFNANATTLGSAALTVDTWYKIAFVVSSGTTATLYTAPLGSALSSASGAWFTGTHHTLTIDNDVNATGVSTRWGNWDVAGFKQWSVALTQSQIEAEFTQLAAARTSGLVRSYPFAGGDLSDYSGNGNHLTAGSTSVTAATDPPFSAGPTLAASYLVTASTNGTTSLTTAAFTPTANEVIVVKASTNDSGTTIGTPTGGSLTYTSRGAVTSGSFCSAAVHTTTAGSNPTSMTVSQPFGGDTGRRSMVVERWTNAALAASPAVNTTKTGSGAPSTTLTTASNNSVVSWVNGDWNANSPTSRAYRTSATEVGIHDQSGAADNQYVGYYAWQAAAAAGSQTLGLTAPTGQAWSLIGVEVQASVVAPSGGDTTGFFFAQAT